MRRRAAVIENTRLAAGSSMIRKNRTRSSTRIVLPCRSREAARGEGTIVTLTP
jgi:hypothetical protein